MNVQDTKDLHITEGDVRTIHDSSGKQLWGRLNYDTKYAGDIVQQSYTGKNLFNKNLTPYTTTSSTTVEVLDTGIKVQQSVDSTSNLYATYLLGDFSSFAGESVTLSCNMYTSGQNYGRLALGYCKADGSSRSTKVYIYAFSGQVTLQLSASELAERPYLYIYAYANSGNGSGQAGDYVEYTNLQLEFGSTATSYEPYVGGIPAPNPDYPQTVNVVTGTQTVTITGGNVSNNFTLNLGAIELCKIGSYQDYIYKSGNDWYLHKETGKYTFKGDENISYNSGNHGFLISSANVPNYFVGIADAPLMGFSTHFAVNSTTITWVRNNTIGLSSTNTFWCRALSFANSLQDCQTWLTNNTPSVYYTLGVATETQITDATLINQLNAIHEWMTRYGYTATVSGNLPLIINQTSLS